MDNFQLKVDVTSTGSLFRVPMQAGMLAEAAIKTESTSPMSHTEMMISSPRLLVSSSSSESLNALTSASSNSINFSGMNPSLSTQPLQHVETSTPPFHPSVFQQQVISNNPEKFHSHFIKLRSPNRKGQTRYRCVTCSHEFECTGKLRLIQHILGAAYTGNQSKNVRSCPMPYQPLKDALLKIHGQNNGIPTLKSDSSSQPGTPKTSSGLRAPPSIEIRQPISFDSFYSCKSADDSTTAEDCSRSDNEICEFLTGIGATEEDFLNAELGDDLTMKFDDIETNLNPKRLKTGDNEAILNVLNPPRNRMYSIANKAVIQFFSNYRLPVTAVEDPLFLELLSAIRVAGPYYRPSMVTLLQDTQVIGGNGGSNASISSTTSANSSSMGIQQSPRQQLHHGNMFSMSAPDLRSAFNSQANLNNMNLVKSFTEHLSNTMTPPQQLPSNANSLQSSGRNSPLQQQLPNQSIPMSQTPQYNTPQHSNQFQHLNQHLGQLRQTHSMPSMPTRNQFNL